MSKAKQYDVVMIGGGLMGLSMAAILGQLKISVAVVEKFPLPKTLEKKFDGRTTALSLGTRRIMEAAGLWDSIKKDSSSIDEIRVADGASPFYLHFDHKEIGDQAFGWIVDNRLLRKALSDRLQKIKSVDYIAPAEAISFENKGGHIEVGLKGNKTPLLANLLIGADGKFSAVREWAGIGAKSWDYEQSAIVCCVTHELDHEQIAVEHFLPEGPFAILPMTNDEKGRYRSSVVWTVEKDQVDDYLSLDLQEFNAELQKRFGPHLGRVSQIGGRFSYPLSLQHADYYTAERTALIGEAAHKIHPIAGQGLNLGMRDVALLSELIVEHKRLGLDIGSTALLKSYEDRRRLDNKAMAVATDQLNKLFSNDIGSIRQARQIGLGLIEKTPFLKRFFMRQAMGLSGANTASAPKLLRGEKL